MWIGFFNFFFRGGGGGGGGSNRNASRNESVETGDESVETNLSKPGKNTMIIL